MILLIARVAEMYQLAFAVAHDVRAVFFVLRITWKRCVQFHALCTPYILLQLSLNVTFICDGSSVEIPICRGGTAR